LKIALFSEGGDISFYDSAGSSQSFFWDASAEALGIGTSSPSGALDIGGQHILYDNYDALGASFTRNGAYGSVLSLGRQGVSSGVTLDYPADNTFALSTNATEAMRIDSSGRVGIGTSSPATPLDVAGGVNSSHATFSGQAGRGLVISTENTLNNDDGVSYNAQTSSGKHLFKINGTEAMRLDASGNLLVGTTDSVVYNHTSGEDEGIVLGNENGVGAYIQVARQNAGTAFLNRMGTDGAIVDLRKNGTPVGSIGVINSNNLFISGSVASHAGIQFGTNTVAPMVAGAGADDAVDLGNSTDRFQDLYLSGGAYLGGTGAANKLDDYEEGTWTPAAAAYSGVMTVNSATYEKIGRQVTIRANLTFDGTADGSAFQLVGLPFSQTVSEGAVGASSGSAVVTTFYATAATTIRSRKYDGSSVTYTNMGAATIDLTYVYSTAS